MDERVGHLPKWARELIEALSRERDKAVKALNKYHDNQTKSSFYHEDRFSIGEDEVSFKKVYIQAYDIKVKHKGVFLQVRLGQDGINLRWEDEKRHGRHVAFIPENWQGAVLIAKENMRD